MNWEHEARVLAGDLRTAAVWLLVMSGWLWAEVDGWATVLPAIGVLSGFVLLAGARIKP